MNGFFISGTDTGTGKTLISAMLLMATRGRYWKPVQSGILNGTDTDTVRKLTGLGDMHFEAESYMLKQPLSPHHSSRLDNIRIETGRLIEDFKKIKTRVKNPDTLFNIVNNTSKLLIIEGAGGLLVPLNDHEFVIDFARELDFPVILVSRSTLGTINHTLLSLEALKSRNITVAGVVMSGPENSGNRTAIETFGRVKVLAEIPVLENLTKQDLILFGTRIIESLRIPE
ncbi:MAG: dethiobiotin synthase [Cyclonatronaceae bacterium]